MDSLTQLTFGAACGEAVLGKKLGNKAPMWGAILGTLPDLDVFIPLGGPINDFVYHRGFSHSFALLAVLSPLIAWSITKVHPDTKQHYRQWLLLAFVVLEGSVLLDLMTIYGTQVLWPFDTIPKAIPVLFIIDPLFTLPILVGVLCALILRRNRSLGHRLNTFGLSLSLAYLAVAMVLGAFVNQQVAAKLTQQDVAYDQVIASPAPFTILLWRVVGIDGDRYFETYYSPFDGDAPLAINFHPRNLALMRGIEDHPPVAKLERFTRGYFAFSTVDDAIVMADLRMGAEPDYVFRFAVAKQGEQQPVPIAAEQLPNQRDWRSLTWIWRRIWTPIPKP